tara:strand:- start:502 stop:1497 length:996 start_codon:yes stop_codon:yes gene_type:complete
MKLIELEDKIFIAGHKGMAGRAILKAFKNKGYNNFLLESKDKLNLKDSDAVDYWFSKNKPQIVILAAAKVGGILANNSYPYNFLIDNLKINTNVIEAAYKNNVKRFLFLGSSCIYPKLADQPITEESLLSGPLEPTNDSYAIAKIAGIKLCTALRKQFNFDAISLMPTNLYGPGDNYNPLNSHVIPGLIQKFHTAKEQNLDTVFCWGTGKPMREFLHVNELGSACVFALENWNPDSLNSPRDINGNPLEILNVGTGKDISIKDLAEMIANLIGFKGTIKWDKNKPDGTMKKLLNVQRINKLGWHAQIKINNGLKETYSHFLEEIKIGNVRV